MTDEELIGNLRDSKGWPNLGNAAADRIEKLKEDLKSQIEHTDDLIRSAEPMMALALGAAENAAEIAEAKLVKAVDALQTIAKKPLYDGLLLLWWIDSTVNRAKSTLDELEKTE